ncbi:unnamed protein product [Linum trigynum]|uniref:Phosphoribosylformimino-5-aminoimidazole carboxamide ribotide isomerase n=1 Tax=Linum trigynum TaxID=586398 RepID=A0AAV2F2D4_9ROSI
MEANGLRLEEKGFGRKTSITIGGGVALEDILALGPGCGLLTMVGSRSTCRMGFEHWNGRQTMDSVKHDGLSGHGLDWDHVD